MAEPRTHYQVSFTSKQAVLLFAGVLVALAVAYLLGVATGLAGREPAETSASAATPIPIATAAAPGRTPVARAPARAPTAVAAAAARASPTAVAAAAREPTAAPTLQFFEEGPEEPTAGTPAPAKKAAASEKAGGGFWVQVLSTRSRREADSRRTLLAKHGHHAMVSTAHGAEGEQYRVRVGPFASREEASRASGVLGRGEKVKPWIVPPGK